MSRRDINDETPGVNIAQDDGEWLYFCGNRPELTCNAKGESVEPDEAWADGCLYRCDCRDRIILWWIEDELNIQEDQLCMFPDETERKPFIAELKNLSNILSTLDIKPLKEGIGLKAA